jgi:carboxylesterase type B
MVFIPGGDFQYLSASLPLYEAERFVNNTNTICVSIQYRLGEYNQMNHKTHVTFMMNIDNQRCAGFSCNWNGPK